MWRFGTRGEGARCCLVARRRAAPFSDRPAPLRPSAHFDNGLSNRPRAVPTKAPHARRPSPADGRGKRKYKTQSLKSETTTPQSPFSPPAAERSGERAVPFLGPADHVMRDIVKRHRGFSVGRFMIVEPLHGSSARRGAPTSQQQVPPSPRAQRAKSRPLRSRKKKIVPKEGLEPSRPFERRILNPLRLPFRHFGFEVVLGRLPDSGVPCTSNSKRLIHRLTLRRIPDRLEPT